MACIDFSKLWFTISSRMTPFRIAAFLIGTVASCTAEIAVVVPENADAVEKLAASELAAYLARMYPAERFTVTHRLPAGRAVEFTHSNGAPESFSVSAKANRAVIAAADPRGALYAVYTLLDKLGCGFYLSYETMPTARPGSPNFMEWKLDDAPLVRDRIVFDWHNFLSSASTWEYGDWVRYIDSAARMRFNDVMVHAYGNNPMFTFRFAGMTKPIGFLATTRTGRDWGTQHVNDVRRLIGGDLFTDAVFGASIAKVEPEERANAAMGLMQRVFARARERGLNVTFALDVDAESANPQEMIRTLPVAARISSGPYQLANPDTREGYAFYKAQAAQLLAAYPQITRLAVWFRNNGTPWTEIKLADFPEAWKREFRGDPPDASMFAIGKLVAAFGRALRDTGHGSVELAAGSWRLGFLESADRYLPREATLIPLDWATVFDTPAGQRDLRAVRSGRRLVPIVWAHHDDRAYIGRPYTPYVNFHTLLKSAGGSGFGIIHWTTRPLDLYFRSTVDQVWRATENQPLELACQRMAVRTFGTTAAQAGGDYLFAFITEAPMFGRETSDRFMDAPLKDPVLHLRRTKMRIGILDGIDRSMLAPDALQRLDYFRNYERFLSSFFEAQMAWESVNDHLKAGEFTAAREKLGRAKPEEVIDNYASAVRIGGANPGEKALVISLNLRWLPYFISARQAAGMEPVRVRIGKVEVEPLAQGAGHNTFYFDEQGRVWRILDADALGGKLRIGGIMGDRLEPGRYRINGGPPVEAINGLVEVTLPLHAEEVVITRSK